MAARKEIPRELSIYINDREVINSLGGVTREITKVNSEMRNLNKNSATYDADLKKLQNDLIGLKDRQTEFKDEIQSTTEVSGEAREALSQMLLGLSTGNLNLAKAGLLGLKSSMSALVSSSLAFIATPIGATIAVLAGITYATKQWFDYNKSIQESTRLIENLSGKTGQAVADIRNVISGLAKSFGLEFDSIAMAVDNLVDTGVAKDELEALDKIKNGLLTAPDKNEFIASLESSSLVAKQVGMDLEDVIALKEEIEATGVDPEATFGALQKAVKNLSEQSDTLKLKLSDALGAGFSNDILDKVKNGEITINQALISIGQKAKEVGLNQKQQAELTTAIFGKSGLAAGGLLTVTEELTAAQEKQTKGLTPLQQSLKELTDSEIELQKAQDDVLRSDGFEKWKNKLLITFNEVKKGFYSVVYDITNGFGSFNEKAKADAEKNGINEYAKESIKSFEKYIELRKKSMGTEFDLEKVRQEKLKSLQESYSNVGGGSWDDPTASQLRMQKRLEAEITAIKQYAPKKAEINKKATEDEVREASDAAKKIADAKQKARDEEKKKNDERIMALLKAEERYAKASLDYFLASNKSKIDANAQLTEEIVQDEVNRLLAIKNTKDNSDLQDANRQKEKAEKEGKSADEIRILKEAIDLEYNTKKQTSDLEFVAATDLLKKQYEEQQKQLKLEQLAFDAELELAEATTKSEEDRIKQEQQYQSELARYKKAFEDKKITEEEYNRFKKAAKDKQDQLDYDREIKQTQATLGSLGSLANAAGELFGQSKELALAQAAINGAQAVTSILAQWPKFDGGFSMYTAIAAAVLSTAASVKNINKEKAPKKPKFFYGGFNNYDGSGGSTGNINSLGNDEFGPVTGVTHVNEWIGPEVMTKSPRYAPVFKWLENERKGIYGNKFASGGFNTSNSNAPIPDSNTSSDDMTTVLRQLNSILSNGIFAKVLFGYPEAEQVDKLNSERNQSKTNGTLNS